MRDREPALEQTIVEVAAILGEALVRLLSTDPINYSVDFQESESRHVTAG
jgi:hypothetical protein